MGRIGVILAEDGSAVRKVLVDALSRDPSIEVLGEACNGAELVSLCRKTPPDVAVVDIRMPVMDGVAAARILRAEALATRLLILTTFDDDEYLRALFGIGIDGYLLKSDDPHAIVSAVHSVHHGVNIMDGAVSRKIGNLLNTAGEQPPSENTLTDIERQAAQLILDGKYNKDIAVEMDISYGRARNIVSGLYRKLGALDRDDLRAKLGGRDV